jgi:hypothetical protein
MGLHEQELWPEIMPFLRVEVVHKDGGAKRPRIRIEVRPLPDGLKARVLAMTMPCVACGLPIHPIRDRHGEWARGGRSGNPAEKLYYACSCPLSVNVGCARGKAAREEYLRFRDMIGDGGQD